MRFKLFLTLLLIFSINFACEKIDFSCEKFLDFSEIESNIEHVFNHVNEIQIVPTNTILGFHHYNPIAFKKLNEINVEKINDNLWVITKGNPTNFHVGLVLYISEKIHLVGFKSFFPSLWNKKTLFKKISKVIAQIQDGNIDNIKCKNNEVGCNCKIQTTLNSQPIILLISYRSKSGEIKVNSIYPLGSLDEINIPEQILQKLIAEQLSTKKKAHLIERQRSRNLPSAPISQKPNCVIL
ncbi:MAG: hypothetical protein P4L22_05790 [Candidatus Babeliales bacterium]|nr:hypothetical protein [Candidatus Babeliales bacterium]